MGAYGWASRAESTAQQKGMRLTNQTHPTFQRAAINVTACRFGASLLLAMANLRSHTTLAASNLAAAFPGSLRSHVEIDSSV